jgi:hypothetical protein
MLAQAKKACAEALVEESLEILDEADADRDSLAKAKEQANHRRWMASRMDREAFGDATPSVNVNVSLPQLHLDALRARVVEVKTVPRVTEGYADVEIVQDGE